MNALWHSEVDRLMHLAEVSARSALRGIWDQVKPFTDEDLTQDLIAYALDEIAQKARGQTATPGMSDALVVTNLSRVGREIATTWIQGARAVAIQEIGLGGRLTAEEADELGHEVKIGVPLPNEGRDFVERVLGNPDADPGQRRLLERGVARMTRADRAGRADVIYKKYVAKAKLDGNERKRLQRAVEELTDCINQELAAGRSGFGGAGTRRVLSNSQARNATRTEVANF